ncbi:MAG: alkaline phosphatase PhoX, partial [bacterium]
MLGGTVLGGTVLGVAALVAGFRPLLKWWRLDCRGLPEAGGAGYGPLRPDPEGILDLPEGFSYRMLCRSGELMDDGFLVPGAPDGTGVFAMPNGEYRVVRNHELAAGQGRLGPFHGKKEPPPDRRYDPFCHGGTTTLVLDGELRLRRKFLSLAGTERNCAGGTTPWGSWISCEESRAGPKSGKGYRRDHGFAFQVDAAADGLGEPVPLVAMGRFFREGAAVHPGR